MMSADQAFFALTRRYEKPHAELPALSSDAEAYKIQNIVCPRGPDRVAWKLGGVNQATRSAFNVDRVYAGPIAADQIGAVEPRMPATGFGLQCQAELEVVVKLTDAVTDPQASAADIICEIAPALECPASVLSHPQSGVLALIADGCAAGSLVLGAWRAAEQEFLEHFSGSVSLSADGIEIASGRYENLVDGLVGTVLAFLDLAAEYELPVKPGDLVSTGGLTPCVPLPVGQKLQAGFAGLGDFSFQIESGTDG